MPKRRAIQDLHPLAALVLAASLAVPPLAGGTAAASPVKIGMLTGRTTIRWSGAKGIRLQTPRQNVILPDEAMKLYVVGGTFAYVEIEAPYRSLGLCGNGVPHCNSWDLMYIRDLTSWYYPPTNATGDAHATRSSDPPDFDYNIGLPLDLYLITDGAATLVLRPKGFTGTASYTAGGIIRGKGERLPIFCPVKPCNPQSGYAGAYRFGGDSFDVGNVGLARVYVYSTETAPQGSSSTTGDAAPLRMCLYPGWNGAYHGGTDTTASPRPQDHPFGCDPLPHSPANSDATAEVADGTTYEIENAATSAFFFRGLEIDGGAYQRHGLQYIGYHAGAIDAKPTVQRAYGIWHEYGIH